MTCRYSGYQASKHSPISPRGKDRQQEGGRGGGGSEISRHIEREGERQKERETVRGRGKERNVQKLATTPARRRDVNERRQGTQTRGHP